MPVCLSPPKLGGDTWDRLWELALVLKLSVTEIGRELGNIWWIFGSCLTLLNFTGKTHYFSFTSGLPN